MSRLFVLFLFLAMSMIAQAQEQEEPEKGRKYKLFETKPLNEDYVIDYSDQLVLKLYGIVKSNDFSHVNHLTEDELEYHPNENFNIGFGFAYKFIGLDLAFNFRGVNHDDDQYGKTKSFDIQSSMYTRKFAIDLVWQRYKGYYMSNPQDYIAGYNIGIYPIRPDIKTRTYGVSLLYVFNHDDFSYRAAFNYNERQIKSAGSFLAGPYFSYYRMDADSSLIIDEAELFFDTSVDFRGTAFIKMGLAMGYGHTFVIGKRVFFSLSVIVGGGPEIEKRPELNGQAADSQSEFALHVATRAAIGYNSDRFFTGISAVAVGDGQRNDNEDYLYRGVSNAKVFVGMRFGAPKVLTDRL
ncbi:DUF4421 domain-containing protein [Reichenbachiella carrageenanivorans]|uniref:DUF4421 domain-containing protein n=1 Tax=Reichenbachiella carrageenanivorans TaxID=2979869 RepID=A0ABY6D088_9BACT|nr:DUF4421 domain-containing protein [Reichenbachiella carrageenanivorans]UXX79585.1 DUF4421 domain-containing protein [Reichenbachiella carrageenanivorans]